jgi:hypothetical protein
MRSCDISGALAGAFAGCGAAFAGVGAGRELGSALGAGASAAVGRPLDSPLRLDDSALAVDFDDEASWEEKYSRGTIRRMPTINIGHSRMNAGNLCHIAESLQPGDPIDHLVISFYVLIANLH